LNIILAGVTEIARGAVSESVTSRNLRRLYCTQLEEHDYYSELIYNLVSHLSLETKLRCQELHLRTFRCGLCNFIRRGGVGAPAVFQLATPQTCLK